MLKTALVIDDDHLEREYMSEMLTRSGFAVRVAASVPNAAAIARTMRFDCVFIDDKMPGTSGAEALKEVQKDEAAGEDRMYFLMGDARDESAHHYRTDGFTHFLEKPADVRVLREILSGKTVTIAGVDEEETKDDAERAAEDGIEGLNAAAGIANCGTKENYESALKIFYDTLDTKAGEIERHFNDKNYKDYTIKVHALKSSARIIGAEELSAKAAALEDAGNRQDEEMILRDTAPLLELYRSFKGRLAPLFGLSAEDAGKPAADRETIRDAIQSIREFAEQMDYDLVEMVLKSLAEYRLEQKDQERFTRIRTSLLSLDWDAIRKEVSGQ